MTIAFAAAGSVSGNGGCNDFTGTYTADGSSITQSDITPETESCDAMTGGVEPAILRLFPFVDTCSIVDGELNWTAASASSRCESRHEPMCRPSRRSAVDHRGVTELAAPRSVAVRTR